MIGDLVLYENQQNVNALPSEKVKFISNWLGPFVIIEDFGLENYKLADMDGVSFKEPINIMLLKCYYP